jgi:acetoin utilization protein AcuB
MSHPVITVQPHIPAQEALALMKKEKVSRFPVVDKRGHMVGLVSQGDLLNASPSDATSLSMWEINYLMSKITVEKVMTRQVITITEDTPLEEAARIMADKQIGGLPVVRGEQVVGIITETDLFKIFLELLGARDPGLRLSVLVPNAPGELATISKAIFEAGGNIMALGTFLGESSENRELVLKVDGVNAETLEGVVLPYVEKIVDIR